MLRFKIASLLRAGTSIVLVCSVLILGASPVLAISAAQKKVFYGKILAFDVVSSDANCGGGGANIDVDQGFSLGTDPAERRVNLMRAFMQDYGLTPEQAAGPVGNFMHESGGHDLPPDVNEGGVKGPPAFSGGYGWAQWTGGRQTAFIDYAVANNYMASRTVNATDAADYAWLKEELNTGYQSTIDELKNQRTPEDAAVSFEATFERAGVPALTERKANARQAFNEYNEAEGGGGGGGGGGDSTSGGGCGGSGGIVGDVAFPLGPTKSVVNNPEMFADGTADQGGHPYIAFDILADPGTQVRAFASGTVNTLSRDVCGGRLIGIYNEEEDFIVSYLHNSYSNHRPEGATVSPADDVALVGEDGLGCGTPHLHIDAMHGDSRGGCSRDSCPDSVRSQFIDIGPQLFETYQALPD